MSGMRTTLATRAEFGGQPEINDPMCIWVTWQASVSRRTQRWRLHTGSTKGRVLCLGNSVADQYHDEATFRDVGSTPATLEAAKAADFCGCLPGHVIEIADGEQAHVQAKTKMHANLDLPTARTAAIMVGTSVSQHEEARTPIVEGIIRAPRCWYISGRTLSRAHSFSGLPC